MKDRAVSCILKGRCTFHGGPDDNDVRHLNEEFKATRADAVRKFAELLATLKLGYGLFGAEQVQLHSIELTLVHGSQTIKSVYLCYEHRFKDVVTVIRPGRGWVLKKQWRSKFIRKKYKDKVVLRNSGSEYPSGLS